MRYRVTWRFFCYFFFQEYRVVFTFFCSRNFAEWVDMVMRTWYFSAKNLLDCAVAVLRAIWSWFWGEKRLKPAIKSSIDTQLWEESLERNCLNRSNALFPIHIEFLSITSTLLKNFQISHSKMFLEYNIDILFPSINWVAKTLTG